MTARSHGRALRLLPHSSRVLAGLLAGAVGLWASAATAQSPPAMDLIYQSTVLERATGEPTVRRDTFPACNPSGTYQIVVDNGSDGAPRVSSGAVWLNGVKVMGENDFNQQVARVTRPVSLGTSNSLELRLAGGRGGRARVTVRGDARCLRVRITAPLAGSLLRDPAVVVEGDVESPDPAGVRVLVTLPLPGQSIELAAPVEVNRRRFASWVGLAPGTVRIRAEATDQTGRLARDEITVSFQPDPPDNDRALPPEISPRVGFAPLTVTFGGDAASDPNVDLLDLDVDGDGQPDFRLQDFASPPHRVSHTYQSVGLYVTTMTIRDRTTRLALTSRFPISVIPAPDLAAIWSAFRDALSRADIDGALRFIASKAQARYRRVFVDLGLDLPSVTADLGDITPQVVTPAYANASAVRVRDGVTEWFLVSFVRDADSVWRIDSF